jgi:hypothetical protein
MSAYYIIYKVNNALMEKFMPPIQTPARHPGRPPSDVQTVQVTLRLRPDQVERLKTLAVRKRNVNTSNVSAIVRMAIDEFFGR